MKVTSLFKLSWEKTLGLCPPNIKFNANSPHLIEVNDKKFNIAFSSANTNLGDKCGTCVFSWFDEYPLANDTIGAISKVISACDMSRLKIIFIGNDRLKPYAQGDLLDFNQDITPIIKSAQVVIGDPTSSILASVNRVYSLAVVENGVIVSPILKANNISFPIKTTLVSAKQIADQFVTIEVLKKTLKYLSYMPDQISETIKNEYLSHAQLPNSNTIPYLLPKMRQFYDAANELHGPNMLNKIYEDING